MNCFEEDENLDEVPLQATKIKSVELKSCRKLMDERQERNFRSFKTVRYWSHSALVNNQKIAIAFFDDNYVVDEIKEYELRDLTKGANWSSRVCNYQFSNILSFIKRCFRQNQSTSLLKFRHDVNSKRIICEESTKQFVPDFYKDEL